MINKILDKLKDDDWYDELDLTGDKWIELKQTETKQILDYITNLQEEVEYKELWRVEYLKRIEKAIELINLKRIRLYHEVDYNLGIEDLKDIENILQNGSDEE